MNQAAALSGAYRRGQFAVGGAGSGPPPVWARSDDGRRPARFPALKEHRVYSCRVALNKIEILIGRDRSTARLGAAPRYSSAAIASRITRPQRAGKLQLLIGVKSLPPTRLTAIASQRAPSGSRAVHRIRNVSRATPSSRVFVSITAAVHRRAHLPDQGAEPAPLGLSLQAVEAVLPAGAGSRGTRPALPFYPLLIVMSS